MKRVLLTAGLMLLATVAAAQTQQEVVYTDDFQSYGTPADPPGWIDNPVGVPSRVADGLYKTRQDPTAQGNVVYGTVQASGQPDGNTPRIGSFSTLSTHNFSGKGRFEYRGRMIRTAADARIGLTFLSSYTDIDRYYLIGLWSQPSGGLAMQLFGFNAGTVTGTTNSNFVPDPGVWYRFAIQVDDTAGRTNIRARFWRDGTAEPSTFAIDAADASPDRLTAGRIGMWAAVRGDAFIDDVFAKSPVDHTAPSISILESGSPLTDGSKFNRNAIPEIRVEDDLSTFTYTATLDGAPFTSLTPVTAEGWHTLAVRAVDGPGNTSEAQVRFLVDKTAPVVVLREGSDPFPANFHFNRDVIATATVSDASETVLTATLDGNAYILGSPISAEGNHSISVTAVDEVGWSTTVGPVAFTIDKTPPTLTFTSHRDGDVLGEARAVIAGGSDDAISVTVNGTSATLDPAAKVFTTGSLALLESENVIVATGQDRAGNIGSATLRLILDTRPPALTILTPAADSCIDATSLEVRGSALDPRLQSVTVTVGSQSVAATVDSATGSWTATVPVPQEQKVLITVEAKDTTGHSVSSSRSVTIDRTAPVIEVRENGAPFAAAAVNRAVTFFLRAQDADPDVAISATLDGAPYTSGAQVGGEGAHTLAVTATDCAGHRAEKSIDFTIDMTPPTIRDLVPANGSTVRTIPASITGRTDPDATAVEVVVPATSAAPGSDGAFTIAGVPFVEGTNVFTLTARDRAGNTSSVDYSVRVKTTGPIVEIRESGSPIVNGTLFNRVVTPFIRSSELDATITATLNGAPFTSGTAISADGSYTLRATATDTVGNSGSEEVTFTIDRTPPVVTITSPESGPAQSDRVDVLGTAGDATTAALNGQPLTLGPNGSFAAPAVLLEIGPNTLVVTARDAAGNTGRDEVLLTRELLGSGIIITYPPDRSRTNRPATDVVGRVLTPGRATSVTIGSATVPIDSTGGFRLTGYQLTEGENAITATVSSANGTQSSATTHVTADFTPPALTILESGQPLADGARFASQAVISLDASDAGGGAVTTSLTVDGAAASASTFTITATGGHALIATATDLAGNQSRVERTLFIGGATGTAGCRLEGFDPADGAVILSSTTMLGGRTGGAAGVKVNGIAATVADGAFVATVELPAEGPNPVTIACTDPSGQPVGTPVTLTLQRVTGDPSIAISSPDEGFISSTETIAVSGTVGPGVISADVNGVAATIAGTDTTIARTFHVPAVRLAAGLNLLVARGRNGGGRTAAASRRGLYIKDAPAIQISSPGANTTTGSPTIAVSGTFRHLDPASLVVENLTTSTQSTAEVVRTSDTTGRFTAPSISLIAGEQTLRVSGRDRVNRAASATVIVRLVAGTPAISITSPSDQTTFGGGSESVPVSGTFQAADGSIVDVNGVVAAISGTNYSATVSFSKLAGGITPIVARVTEPGGASASAVLTVTQLTGAPTVIESFPAPNAVEVDRGALLLVLFSQPMDLASMSGAFRLEDASGAPVSGSMFLDRDVLTFAPATLLAPGSRYTLRVTTGARNLGGTSLQAEYTSPFTVATTAPVNPPALTPIGSAVCGESITISGTAAPGARVRLETGTLTLNTSADGTGRFSFTWPLSGQSGYAVIRVRVIGSDGSLSPAAELNVRVDCSGPQVTGATYDRNVNTLTIAFSEPVDSASVTVGAGNAILLALEDGRTVGGSAAVAQSTVVITPSEDLRAKTFAVTVTAAVRDVIGNPLVAPYTTTFATGSDQPVAGDGSGFISGEVYDATTGRPLPGVSIAINVATASPITTTSDARGRYLARLPEGAHTIRASAGGYTTVWREIIVPAGAGVIPIDMRLTRRGTPATGGSAIALSHGGETAVTRRIDLNVPAGSLASGFNVSLTSMGGQALPGLLPLGWSPISAAEVNVDGAETTVALNGSQLTFYVPAAEIVAASQNLAAVSYDAARDEWRVVASVVNVASDGKVVVPIASSGAYALVYADKAPGLAAPPLPTAGDVLRGVAAAPADAPALVKRDFQLDPQVVLPNGRAVATLRIEGAGAAYPSGTAVQAYIDEELRLADGSMLLDPPFATDLLLYRTLSGDAGVADFHLAPSAKAAQVVLETGVDHIRVFPYPGRLDRGTLVGSEGGPVPADDRISIEIPSGAVPEPLRATAASLSASELQSIGAIAGFRVVGGFQLTLQRATEQPPADLDGDGVVDPAGTPELFIPARATFSVDAALLPSPGAQIILGELLDQTPYGRMVRLAVPMMPVDATPASTPVVRFTTRSIDRSVLAVDGVVREGRYILLAAEAPIAFATGIVRSGSATGRLLADARVRTAGLGVSDLSRATGIYNVPVPSAPAAPFQLVPRHPSTGDGAPYVHATAPDRDAIVRADLSLVPQPPVLGPVVVLRGNPPSQGALTPGTVTRDVALTTNIRASFSPAVDPSSVGADSIVVTDALTNTRVSGSASADGSVAVVWTLTAGQLLRPNGRYIVAITPSVRGSNGAPLAGGVSFTFETIREVVSTEVNRDKVRITIPTDAGVSRISGDPGALPAGWQAVAVRRGTDFKVRYQATAAADGSFSFLIGNGGDPLDRVTIADLIDLQVVNSAGNLAAIFALTPFASEDGKSFVVPAGAAVRYTTPEGLTLDVPEGAFDVPTVISINAATKQEFLDIPSMEAENEFIGSVRIDFEGTAKKPLGFEAPVPAGFDTADKQFILAQKYMSTQGPRLAVIDLMAVSGNKFVIDHGESTNASAIVVEPGLRAGTNQTLTGSKFTRYLTMLIRSGIYTYLDIRQPVGGSVGWAVMEGLQANYDIMWDLFASYIVPYLHVFERGGALLPIVTGKRFTVVGIDPGTGLQAISRTYDPIPFGPPGTVTPIDPAEQNDGGPYPVYGSPFRVEMLDVEVEDVEIRSIRNFVAVLSNGSVQVSPGTPALDPSTKVTLINASKGLSMNGTASSTLQLPADPGNRIVLLIEERQVDPTSPISIVFNEPIYVVDPSDPEVVNLALQELIKVEYSPGPPGATPAYTDITLQVRFTADSGQRRVNLQLPSVLQSAAVYRITLKPDIADSVNGTPELTLGQGTTDNGGVLTPVGGGTPFELHFSVRKPAGELGSFSASDRGLIRGMDMTGNVLFVAAWDGGLRSYDVSNPAAMSAAPSPIGSIPGQPETAIDHLSVTIDRHNRVYTTAHLPIAGLFRSYRVESFKGNWLQIPVKGSKIINWKLGYSSSIGLPSNTVLSDVPESIPFRIKVLLQDDETNFKDRKEFVAMTGASETGDYPSYDLKKFTVSVPRAGTPYMIQRITIENATLDMRWSADATSNGAAVIENVVARSTDRLRLIRNQKTFAIVSHLGYGIGVYDANAIESNREAGLYTNAPGRLREQLILTAGLIGRDCNNETPSYGIVEGWLPTDAELLADPNDGSLYSFSVDPTRGVLDLRLRLPSDQAPGTHDDDCEQRPLNGNTGGLLFRSVPAGNEAERMTAFNSAFSGAAGRQPIGHVSGMARYFWSISAQENAFGLRGTIPQQRAERDYLLVASHEWGLVVVDIDSNPPAVPLWPLRSENIADIIWIPGGATSVRVYQSANIAVVGDRYGRALVVDLSRIDERWDEDGAWVSGLFPTVKKALGAPSNDPFGVGADDPRIIWKSEPGLVMGAAPPVFDPYTGMLFGSNVRKVNVVSALDPRVTMKVNLGDGAGLSDVGGVVPLGVPLPLNIEQRIAGLPACDGTTLACKENASLAAFRLEVSLPGDMTDSLTWSSNELWLAVESERVAGAITEQTPDGFPHSHLRRSRRDGSPEEASRAATNFKFTRVVPDSLRPLLKNQRGYNRFISPWIVAIADPRGSEKYEWQNASTKQQRKEAGCDECDRPDHLKDKTEAEGVFELLTNGRFITVRPELTGSGSIFDGTRYSYLGAENRLLGRFSTVMADTVRPTEVLVAAQNPAVATGELQQKTYVHSGEMEASAVDLNAGGRNSFNVMFDRTYRSRTLGASAFGQGWDSSLLRRIRALPNGEVEFRDGAEVWRFRPNLAFGGYDAPKGLFLKLSRIGTGWRLVDQRWRIVEFDDLGRIVSESDEFLDLQKPDSGNVIRYVYDESGRLSDVIDPVRRRSHLVYWKESEAGAPGAYPGLVKQVVDWRNRKLDYVYDSAGTLVKVRRADVQNLTGTRPTVEYGYSSVGGSYSNQLELRTNLESIKDPQEVAAGGVPRVRVTYSTGGGTQRDRAISQVWGTGESATFTYESPTAATVKDVLGQTRKYSMNAEPPKNYFDDRPHIQTMVEESVTVSSAPFGDLPQSVVAGIPQTSSTNRTTSYTYDGEGQVATETLAGVRAITYSYIDVRPVAPGFVPGSISVTPLGGPTAAVTLGMTYQSGPNASTFVKSVSANGLGIDLPDPSRSNLSVTSSNNQIDTTNTFDSNGLPSQSVSTGGTDADSGGANAKMVWADANAPEHERGKVKSVTVGGLTKTFQYPSATQSISTDARGVVSSIVLDEWDRPVRLTITGPQLTVSEQLEYDATGRIRKRVRNQGSKTVTETFEVDVLGRLISHTINEVAGIGSATTTKSYDLSARTITTNFPSGAVKTVKLDSLGRTVSETTTTGTSGSIQDHFAYDLLDNIVFISDLFNASAKAFDAYDQLVGSMGVDGIKTRAIVDAWGRVTGFRKEDSGGQIIAESTLEYAPAGNLKSISRKLDGAQRVTTFAWDGGGRTTGMSVAGRAQRTTFDAAGRMQSRAEGAGSATSVGTPFRSTQIASHSGRLPQQGTTTEKGGGSYGLALEYNTLGDSVSHNFGGLDWKRTVDQAGNVTSFQAPHEGLRTFDFDSRNAMKTEVFPDGATNTYGYHPTGALASYTDPSSEVTETVNDLIGRPILRKYKDGTEEKIEWEGRRVKSIIDRQNRAQIFTYNAKGQIETVRSSSEVVLERIEYDSAGRVTRWSNADAVLEFSDFDAEGHPRKTSQSRLDGGSVVDKYAQEHTWNLQGERSSWTMPTYPSFFSLNPWTTLVSRQYDAMGNVTKMDRTLTGGGSGVFLEGDYRDAGRPTHRTITSPGSNEVLARNYGYDGSNGLLNRMAVVVNGKTVAGSEVEFEGTHRVRARLLGLSGDARSDEWIYDARSRLRGSKLALDSDATPQGEQVTAGDFRAALDRPARQTPVDPLTILYTEDSSGGHKIKVMQRGMTIEQFAFNGGERIEDGRFKYEYDAKGRLSTVTENKQATVIRRSRYFYDPRGRLVGRRAEYAVVAAGSQPQPADWRLEDRPAVLAAEALPADTTFVWDPMSDQLVALFKAGSSQALNMDPNGGLIRQIIHGGLGHDDPLEIAAADATAPGGVTRLYPIYDEAGGRSLQVVLNGAGEIVARSIAAGPYGEDQAVLAGPAVDAVSVAAKKDEAGNLISVDITMRATEQIAQQSVASGFRLATVDADGVVLRTSSTAPAVEDDATIKWSLTSTDWATLTSGGGAAISIAATSSARAATWGDSTQFLAAPSWAIQTRPVFTSAALPIEVRESLAGLSQWLASIPAGEESTTTVYEIENLFALAAPRVADGAVTAGGGSALNLIVSSPFHAHPFQDPFTGQNYVRARWFDLHSGAWLTPDPAGYDDSPNLYSYAGGDPVNSIDSTGRNSHPGDDPEPSRVRRFVTWLAREAVTTAVEELSPVGIANGLLTAAIGYDVLRGEEVEGWVGRGLALASAIPIVPSAVRKLDDVADAAGDASRAARSVPTSNVDDAARAVPGPASPGGPRGSGGRGGPGGPGGPRGPSGPSGPRNPNLPDPPNNLWNEYQHARKGHFKNSTAASRGYADFKEILQAAAKTDPNSIRVVRGRSDKVAVIGRYMEGRVTPVANHFGAETFSKFTDEAQEQFADLISKGHVPDDVMRGTLMYKQNQEWIQKIIREGYTIIDIGGPAGSVFYDMERLAVYGAR